MLKKKWGQHLLVSSGVLERLVELAEIKEEVVVEIGPGTGNLTKRLLATPLKRLYLLEIDPEMVEKLKVSLNDPRLVIFQTDATTFDFNTLNERELKLIGNLPYNVASLIIENTIYHKHLVYQAFYMVQKEVAERLIQQKSWLSVFVNTFYQLEYLMSIPPRFFIPPPKVNSAYLKFTRKSFDEIKDLKKYKSFLVKLFSQKRKMLKQKIPPEILEKASILPEKRVEELKLSDFITLYQVGVH
ncbi:16S rRNA (adenine(1518)-N(6)/adenine(1519)-N(6))-dimethyltransferase RsmA [Thermodesulfobacterium hveragerdense]|uniref:16S rRNA (adenine(1518)-N(6)/adenine(1519)-N(6))- dimethyltransferase RsmA n=1 Tax=Thermodesulfobacterium hveragerdense TaxID=53424 RepID=UPI0003F8CDD3|nr:16S rRNA (adenine(1518)-N(6)/adenine(1519)-N(6))-dimethyltransferase RsmA [Thermodesulfobacterium hveragerdense]